MHSVLILTACGALLVGCAHRDVSKVDGGGLLTKDEIVRLKDNEAGPWQLLYGITGWSHVKDNLFVTVHERKSDGQRPNDYRAAIYTAVGHDKFKLLTQLDSGGSYFLQPVFAMVRLSDGGQALLMQLTEVEYGTGHFTTEHIFFVQSDGTLRDVEFVPAPESFKQHLKTGEGVWKGAQSLFENDKLTFNFYIWKDGDGNCCPSAGKVVGKYKIERKADGDLRVLMDTFVRSPVDDSN